MQEINQLFSYNEYKAQVTEANSVKISVFLFGLLLFGGGMLFLKNRAADDTQIVVVTPSPLASAVAGASSVVVEISGAVIKPGVYKFEMDGEAARVEDVLTKAGGLSADADRPWVEKNINRASIIKDGQKIYIARIGEVVSIVGVVNSDETTQNPTGVSINQSTQSQLESLPGIGPAYAKKIIEHRPYSTLEELVSKAVLSQNLFAKIKDIISL